MAERCLDSDLEPPFAAELGKNLFHRMISEELSKESRLKREQTNLSPTTHQAGTLASQGDGLSLPMSEGKGLAEAFLRLPENQPASVRKVQEKINKKALRTAEEDFFRPLFHSLLSSGKPSTDDVNFPVSSSVPKLTELCMSVMLQNSLSFGGPSSAFISHMAAMAKGTDEALITLRLRWAWAGLRDKKQQEMLQSTKWWPQEWSFPEPIEGFPWSHPHSESVFRSMICRPTPLLEFFTALAPARPPIPLGIKVDVGMPVIRALFHLVDTLFGCCCCYGRNMLTVLQVQEVATSINKLLQKRCPGVTAKWPYFQHLWPPYVCWSRGWLEQAAELFTLAYDRVDDYCTQAMIYGELARMFTQFGDHKSATTFLSRFLKQDVLSQLPCAAHAKGSVHALIASIWDTGVMEGSSAANAARWWKEVVDCGPNGEVDMHALCLAAVESALCVHALQCSGLDKVHTPERPHPVQEWASEIEALLSKVLAGMQCGNYGYYKTLIHSMFGRLQASDEAWMDYTALLVLSDQKWCTVLPVFSTQDGSPWFSLYRTFYPSSVHSTPFLPLRWRTRLLWPVFFREGTCLQCSLADHCSPAVNLRLTEGGHITADVMMDFPPMDCILLDPLSGSLVFDSAERQRHYLSAPLSRWHGQWQVPDLCAVPKAVRLVEGNGYVVEAVSSHCWDISVDCLNQSAKTHHVVLTRTSVDGRQKTVNVLSLAKDHLKRAKHATKKLFLDLLFFYVFAKGTLVLFFTLESSVSYDQVPQFIMFVQCTNEEAFVKPHCYYEKEGNGFLPISPCPETVQAYPGRWLSHISAVTMTLHLGEPRTNKENGQYLQLVFNADGQVIGKIEISQSLERRAVHDAYYQRGVNRQSMYRMLPIQATNGHLLYRIDVRGNGAVKVAGERNVGEPLVSTITDPAATYSRLCSLPGILLVVTLHEVFLFDPATLAPLTVVSNSKPLQMPPLSGHDNVIAPSGGAVIDRAAVLWVRDLTESSSGDGQQSCMCEAALGLDSLLIIIRREARSLCVSIVLQVRMPGVVYEYFSLGKKGHIVVSSLVRDQTREEMYWLTTDGRLCGIVPCLGHEPHSFLALTQTDSGELMPHEGGVEADILLYFNDGQGAICCVKLVS